MDEACGWIISPSTKPLRALQITALPSFCGGLDPTDRSRDFGTVFYCIHAFGILPCCATLFQDRSFGPFSLLPIWASPCTTVLVLAPRAPGGLFGEISRADISRWKRGLGIHQTAGCCIVHRQAFFEFTVLRMVICLFGTTTLSKNKNCGTSTVFSQSRKAPSKKGQEGQETQSTPSPYPAAAATATRRHRLHLLSSQARTHRSNAGQPQQHGPVVLHGISFDSRVRALRGQTW